MVSGISLHPVAPVCSLYSSVVSPLAVPSTTDVVILAGRESLPQLFQHKVTGVSPRGPSWGGHQSGHSPQLWLGEGQFTCEDTRARGEGAGAGTWLPTAMPRPQRLSEKGEGHFSQGVDGFMKEAACSQLGAGRWALVLLPQVPRYRGGGGGGHKLPLPAPRSWLIFLRSLPPHAAGKQSERSGSPQPPVSAPCSDPAPFHLGPQAAQRLFRRQI